MIANFGFGAMVTAFFVSLYGIGAALYGLRRNLPAWVDSARNAMLLTFPLLSLTAASIIALLLLGHPCMILHPPMLYLGFVSFVIPYAFAFAALVTGRSDDRWIRITRRWT